MSSTLPAGLSTPMMEALIRTMGLRSSPVPSSEVNAPAGSFCVRFDGVWEGKPVTIFVVNR